MLIRFSSMKDCGGFRMETVNHSCRYSSIYRVESSVINLYTFLRSYALILEGILPSLAIKIYKVNILKPMLGFSVYSMIPESLECSLLNITLTSAVKLFSFNAIPRLQHCFNTIEAWFSHSILLFLLFRNLSSRGPIFSIS